MKEHKRSARSTTQSGVLLALLKCSFKFPSALNLNKAHWHTRTIKDHNLFARQSSDHCSCIYFAFQMRINTAREKFMGISTATKTRGFKFRSILPTTTAVCMWVQYLPKADKRIIVHCWSCAKEGREFELCNLPWNSEMAHFWQSLYWVWSAFFPRSCHVHIKTDLQITYLFLSQSKNRAWRFGKALFFCQREKNCKQTDCELTSAHGDLKHALFSILDQSERTFYLPHLIIQIKLL